MLRVVWSLGSLIFWVCAVFLMIAKNDKLFFNACVALLWSSGVSQGPSPHHITTLVVCWSCTVPWLLHISRLCKQAAYRCVALEMDVEEHKDGNDTEHQAWEKHTVKLVPVIVVWFRLFFFCIGYELFAKLVNVVPDPADVANHEDRESNDCVA